MISLSAAVARIRSLVRHLLGRSTLEREMDDEFRSHLALRADDLQRRGLSRDDAERTARVEFGALEAHKDAARDARGLRMWDELRANVGFAIRGLGHHPMQSLIVVTTLTLGLGITGVVFSVMNALSFRARVDHDAATFVSIAASFRTDTSAPSFAGPMPIADYLAYERSLRTLSRIAGWQHLQFSLSAGARPTPGDLVTCGFFDVYGPVRPVAGRMLQRDDCVSRAPVAVIGHDLWQSMFGGDTTIVGRALRINGQTIRIVGVAPTFSSASIDDQIWLPYTVRALLQLGPDDPGSANAMRVFVDGRLAPGVTRADVLNDARRLSVQQDRLVPGRRTRLFVTDGSLIMQPGNGLAVTSIVATVFVGLACLALVACASVVSILLAIAHGRRTEMALRMALGAGAPRLAALLATESILLASVAGALAFALTFRLPRPMMEWIIQRPVNFSLGPDWHVFGFLFVTSMLAALMAANAPIRAVLSLDLNSTLRRVPDDASGKGSRGNRLMSLEIGGAAALLVASIALTRLPARVTGSPPRFDSKHVLATKLRAPQPDGGWRAFHESLARELAAVDGVRAIAFATAGPVGDEATGVLSVTPGEQNARSHAVPWIEASPNYFDVFGLRIDRGRAFTPADEECTATCPAIVSRETARKLWNKADPLGHRLIIDAAHSLVVVGVASDAPSRIAEPAQALMVYTPWRPNSRLYQPFVHVDDAKGGVVRRLTSVVNERFPGAVAAPIVVDEQLRFITDAFQRIGELVGLMAAVTAVLAIVGVYGVVALAAKRRLKEMGIRIALGARKRDVYRAMVGPNARPVIAGLVVGGLFATAMAFESDRILAQVFPVRIMDPIAFVLGGVALASVVAVAMLVPARKATAADPAIVLRQE